MPMPLGDANLAHRSIHTRRDHLGDTQFLGGPLPSGDEARPRCRPSLMVGQREHWKTFCGDFIWRGIEQAVVWRAARDHGSLNPNAELGLALQRAPRRRVNEQGYARLDVLLYLPFPF